MSPLDAGTFSPYEHGEVYVLDDGGEVDLDLGNYERFLDVSLTRDNNITTGIRIQFLVGESGTHFCYPDLGSDTIISKFKIRCFIFYFSEVFLDLRASSLMI